MRAPVSAGLQAEPWPFSKGFEVPSDNLLWEIRDCRERKAFLETALTARMFI